MKYVSIPAEKCLAQRKNSSLPVTLGVFRYTLSANALSVYATVINISTFVQCCAYSVGQAAQPILSTNYGAKKPERIRQALFLALPAIFAPDAIWWAMPRRNS